MADTGRYETNSGNAGNAGSTRASEPGLGELLGRLSEQFSRLVRQEIALAKSELREEVDKAKRAAAMFGIVAAAAVLAVFMLLFAIAWGLAEVMPPGLAFLLVALVLGIVAGVLFQRARKLTAEIDPVPETTMNTVKEDAEWLKDRRS